MRQCVIFLGFLLLNFSFSWGQFNENAVLNIPNDDKLPLNWGYFVGLNQFDYQISYLNPSYNTNSSEEVTEILVQKSTGFNVGLIGEMRINELLDLRLEPGFYSGKTTLEFKNQNLITEKDSIREIKSTYINVPLLLKFSANRIGNWRPFIVGGPYAAINLSSKENSIDDNKSGTFKVKKWNYGYQIGVGIDIYLSYFKFTPSIRGVFSITDDAIRDADPQSPWTANIHKMRSRGVFLVLTFE
jgi:hypothetical protein